MTFTPYILALGFRPANLAVPGHESVVGRKREESFRGLPDSFGVRPKGRPHIAVEDLVRNPAEVRKGEDVAGEHGRLVHGVVKRTKGFLE